MEHTPHEGPEKADMQAAAPAAPAAAPAVAAPASDAHATGADTTGERAEGRSSHTTDGSAAHNAAARAPDAVATPESAGAPAPGGPTGDRAALGDAGPGANGGFPNKESHAAPVQPASSGADVAAPASAAAVRQAGAPAGPPMLPDTHAAVSTLPDELLADESQESPAGSASPAADPAGAPAEASMAPREAPRKQAGSSAAPLSIPAAAPLHITPPPPRRVSKAKAPPAVDPEMSAAESSATLSDSQDEAPGSADGTPSRTRRIVPRRSAGQRSARPHGPMLAAGPPISVAARQRPEHGSPAAGTHGEVRLPAGTRVVTERVPPPVGPDGANGVNGSAPDEGTAADMASLGVSLEEHEEELAALNNDTCETCGGQGRFLCCDGCPRSFHFACMEPPLDVDEMPPPNGALFRDAKNMGETRAARARADDSWFCRACCAEHRPPRPAKGAGPFTPLLAQLERENPGIYALPVDIRNYFKGVSTAPDGAYVDSTMLRPLKLSRQGFVEERDPHKLRDKHGHAVLCFRCGGSALPRDCAGAPRRAPTRDEEEQAVRDAGKLDLSTQRGAHWRSIVSCDFCPLHWHLDCVDPPMTSMPSTTRKWRCPAHADHAQPRQRIPRNTAQVQTVSVPPKPEEEPGGKRRRELGEVEVLPDTHDHVFDPETGAARGAEPPWEDLTVTHGATRIRYRIPEKRIRLEFWDKAADTRAAHAERLVRHTPPQAAVPAPPPAPSELDKLVTVALGGAPPPASAETELIPRTPEQLAENAAAAKAALAPNAHWFAPAERTSYASADAEPLVPPAAPQATMAKPPPPPSPAFSYVYPSEVAELRAIKRLMAAKGRDALLQWLHQ